MVIKISAESAKQQSPGWKSAALEPWVEMKNKRSPVRAAQAVKTCFALTGLNFILLCNPGFQSSLRSLFHPGLCCSALSALNLTYMFSGVFYKKYAALGETPALPGPSS
jgi:hypothetical protein